ncbi:MAG: flagellar brake protein [Thermodesulfobacteriota bacterium]
MENHGANRLSIELGSPLNIQFPSESIRYAFSLIGMDIDVALIVKPQAFLPVRHLVVDGTPVIVRYLSHGKVFGFRSVIQGVVSKPIPAVFLTYPNHIETVSLRKKERIYCYLPAQIVTDQVSLAGMVIDLSEGGCRWMSSNPMLPKEIRLSVDDILHVALPLPGHCGVMKLQALIRGITQEPGRLEIGMAFQQLDVQSAENIQRYVSEARAVQLKMT